MQLPIESLSYHRQMIEYLKKEEPALWKWFGSDRLRSEQNEAARLELLKQTYRTERTVNERLYECAETVAAKLGLTGPITFYQSQDSGQMNVSLAYMPGEVHIVLTGPVATILDDRELHGVLGHELLHFFLLDQWQDYLTASQLLAAMSHDPNAHPAHLASARLFQLYTEVYCDRGSYLATNDLEATITALAKIETGVCDIAADGYLRQTEEIFSKGHPVTEGVTHPEAFIRTKAVSLWVEQSDHAEEEITRIIEGPLALKGLDLLGQLKVTDLTKRLIAQILCPLWIRTETIMAHARMFFEGITPAKGEDKSLASDLQTEDTQLKDYFCFILLDFAVVDRDLEDAPLAAALLLAEGLGLGERFRQLAIKELNIRKKNWEILEASAGQIVAKASEEAVNND